MDQIQHNRTKKARDLGRDRRLPGDLPLWPEILDIDLEAPIPLVPTESEPHKDRGLDAFAVAARLDGIAREFGELAARLEGTADAIRNAALDSGLH